jgi:hypothetical protein
MERLRREQALVEGLSDEAKGLLSQEESTKQLFDEDRFRALETAADDTAPMRQPISAPAP